jgi:predicted ATPase/DNA-binding winged helix-turn-helix (wHTH) protein
MEQGLGFGPFALYPRQKLLLEDGAPVDLGSRALDILVLLARRRGDVVSKAALIAAAWPDVFVDEVSLRVHVSALRRSLGDGVGERRFIKTIPGRGYSFVAPVAALGDLAANGSATAWLAPERRIVGRDDLMAALETDLGGERLVTLTGPAGIGKTTVAVEVARRVSRSFGDGSALVDLAPLTDARAIPMTLEIAAGLSNLGAPTLENIAAALSERRMLLIFDNCEHLVESVAAAVEVLIAGTKAVQIISTSREPLGVRGEKLRRVEPLGLPEDDAGHTTAEIRAHPAIELFEHRARAVLDSFRIDDTNAGLAANICRRLDGIPFAIELAASRVDAFGLADISAQLDARMGFLDVSASRKAPRHQRSLRDALAWSYDLLAQDERALLRQLSVFAGAFSLADATDLVGAERRREAVLGIGGLVAKSLLSVDVRGLEARYRLLEMTRLFAAERLAQEDDEGAWRRQHADLVKARLESLATEVTPSGAPAATRYIDDLHVALDWAFAAAPEAERAAALTLTAVPLWTQLSLHRECRRRTERALRLRREGPEKGAQDVALSGALGSAILYEEGPGPAALAALLAALGAARAPGDAEHELRALWALWSCHTNSGDYDGALAVAQDFTEAAGRSPIGDDALIAHRILGLTYYYRGEFGRARRHHEAMLGEYVPPPDGRDIRRYHFEQRVLAESIHSTILWILGFPDQARIVGDRSLGEAQSLGHPLTLTYALAIHLADIIGPFTDAEAARGDLRRLAEQADRFPWSPARMFLDTLQAMFEIRFGDAHRGVDRLEAALLKQRKARLWVGSTNALGFLASGYRRMGDFARARDAIEVALQQSRSHGELWCAAELTRFKGEIARDAGDPDAAAEFFEAAIEEAQAQGALAWELRAATDLARLWSERGRKPDAARLLKGTYAKFSEGFETADLQAAAELLQSLA